MKKKKRKKKREKNPDVNLQWVERKEEEKMW